MAVIKRNADIGNGMGGSSAAGVVGVDVKVEVLMKVGVLIKVDGGVKVAGMAGTVVGVKVGVADVKIAGVAGIVMSSSILPRPYGISPQAHSRSTVSV